MTETIRTEVGWRRRRRLEFLGGVGLLLGFATLVALSVGSVRVPLAELLAAVAGGGSELNRNIVWRNRLPRVLGAIVAGGGLAVAGAAMQTVLRNPLGAPYTLGISQAAAFGAALSIIVTGVGADGASGGLVARSLTPIAAFFAGMVSTGVILALVTYRRATPETMILTGVALGSMFQAGFTLLQYVASDTELAAIVYWTFGDVGRVGWSQVLVMTTTVCAATAYFVWHGWDYDVLDAGTATAKSLGINVESLRIRGMAVASLVTALIVSFVGIIGFVGLVAPHIVRLVIGGTERYLLPASAIVGATLLVVADTAARTVLSPVVLPVGILTSFLGAPLFLYLVIEGRQYWQ